MVDDYSELASCPLSKLLVFLSEVLQHDNIVDCCSQILWGLPENRAEATVVRSVFMGDKVSKLNRALIMHDQLWVPNRHNGFVR